MTSRAEVLRAVMHETGTSQSELSRLSGVRQPSLSQTLSGRIEISDGQLDRLLSCLGYRLEIVRRPVAPDLSRSERRSWELHRQVSRRLSGSTLGGWRPVIDRNLVRLRHGVRGQPHENNVRRWTSLIDAEDLRGLHDVLTGLDRDSIEMREVSPMGGVLSDQERAVALQRIS